MSAQPAEPVTRRERQRAATATEIKHVARTLLQQSGSDGVTLRGIAREMGMTAPGLYRYFPSLDDLVDQMCEDYFAEATTAVGAAIAPVDDVAARLQTAIRAFRSWATSNPAEFRLMFGSARVVEDDACEHSWRFAQAFLGLFAQLWAEQPFDLPDGGDVPAAGQRQVECFVASVQFETDLPVGALWACMRAWVRLFGIVSLEVMGQLWFMFDDVEPVFEAELRTVVEVFGLTYQAPGELSAPSSRPRTGSGTMTV